MQEVMGNQIAVCLACCTKAMAKSTANIRKSIDQAYSRTSHLCYILLHWHTPCYIAAFIRQMPSTSLLHDSIININQVMQPRLCDGSLIIFFTVLR